MKFLNYDGLLYFYQKIKELLEGKVDKDGNKVLSDNNYTTDEKIKLAGIEEGANKYIHPTDAGNKHVPAGGKSGQVLGYASDGTATWVDVDAGEENIVETVKVNGTALPVSNKEVNIDLSTYATKADVSAVYKVKGTIPTYSDLPTTNLITGDVYNIEDTGANYVWTGSDWDKLSETVDLSAYATLTKLDEYVKTANLEPITNSEIDTLLT